jgi:hypothetical protein
MVSCSLQGNGILEEVESISFTFSCTFRHFKPIKEDLKMDYVFDALARVPSQVLVKSSSSFGEEAAKVIGVYVEESLKNATDDITSTGKEK